MSFKSGSVSNIEITAQGWAVLANDSISHSEDCRKLGSIYYDPFGSYEICRPHWKPGDTVLDVGAHIGNFSIPMAESVGPTGKVIAIEADSELCACLKINLAKINCPSIIMNVCAWSETGKLIFLRNMANRGSSTVDHPEAKNQGHHIELEVESIRIDDLGLSQCSFIKIDTEGSELKVLHGSIETIRTCRPVLFIETIKNAPAYFNSTLEDMYDFLKTEKYRLEFYPTSVPDPHDVLCLPE